MQFFVGDGKPTFDLASLLRESCFGHQTIHSETDVSVAIVELLDPNTSNDPNTPPLLDPNCRAVRPQVTKTRREKPIQVFFFWQLFIFFFDPLPHVLWEASTSTIVEVSRPLHVNLDTQKGPK